MIRTKLKSIISYLFAENEEFSLENRLFLSALLIGILISVNGAIISFFISPSVNTAVICILLSVLMLIIYYFIRFRGITEPFRIPMIIISFIGISAIWVYDGGINGSDIMVAFVILILGLIGVKDNHKKHILVLFISLLIIIYLIQLYRPDLIINIPSAQNRWIDSFITAIYCSISIYFIIRFILKNYNIEKKRAEESEGNLKKAQLVAHVGSWIWNIKTDQLKWSDEMYNIFGIERKTFTGKLSDVLSNSIHPDDRQAVDNSNLSGSACTARLFRLNTEW